MAQDRLRGRKARAAGDEEQRPRAGAIDELPDGTFDTQQCSDLQRIEELFGEAAARHMARVQLDEPGIVRGTGDGKTSPATVLEEHVKILPRLKVQRFNRGQP